MNIFELFFWPEKLCNARLKIGIFQICHACRFVASRRFNYIKCSHVALRRAFDPLRANLATEFFAFLLIGSGYIQLGKGGRVK